MKNLFQRLIITTLSAAAIVACTKAEPDPGPPVKFSLKAETKIVNLSASKSEKVVKVKATNPQWDAVVIDATNASWLAVQTATISTVSNVIIKATSANEELASRQGKVRLFSKDGSAADTITVTQLGTAPDLLIDVEELIKVPYTLGVQTINVTTNSPYEIDINAQNGWITEVDKAKAMVKYTHNFSYAQNSSIPRTGVITFKTKDVDPEVKKMVRFSQEGAGGPIVIPTDTLYRPTAARVSDFQGADSGPDLIVDGNYETLWHSQWNLNKPENFPKWVEVDVPTKAKTLDYLVVYPRGGNGDWGKVEILYNTRTNNNWEKIGDYDFQKSGNSRPIFFKSPIVDAKTFRFSIKDGSNGNGTCREIELFKYNKKDPQAEAIAKVFETPACMKLKSGVTDADIEKLPNILQVVAVGLREGTYGNEFRMNSYIAHSSPEYWAEKFKSKKWGQADNPTGIWAKKGDKVVVLVGETWGNQINLFSCDAFVGAHGDNYLLKTGVNEITMKNDGLLYVKYYLEDITVANAKPIEVHIPEGSGYVNGYFDVEVHKTDAEYARLYKLSTNPFRMFDIVGKHAHLIYSRGYIPETMIVAALDWYDKLCYWGWEIMGVDKFYTGGKINHRHVFVSNNDGYMDASDYRTHYHQNTLMERLNVNTMFRTRDLMWGPAHEVGHQHQPVFNFNGYSEASNNFFSNLFTYKANKGSKSRAQGAQSIIDYGFANDNKDVNIGTNEAPVYDAQFKQTPFVLMPRAKGSDVFILQRQYWQLYTYYNIAGKNPQFWPQFFENLRNMPAMPANDPQAIAMEYYKLACDAAKEDLTEFFEHWGWFVVFDVEIDDYGKQRHTLTQAMVDAAKSYVKAKNYPKAAPIEYIEDREVMDQEDGGWLNTKGDTGYYTYFRDNAKIKNTIAVQKTGNSFAVSNWQGAAAFEIWDNNKVTFKTVKAAFTVDAKYLTATVKLYAVQVDGQRIQIWPK